MRKNKKKTTVKVLVLILLVAVLCFTGVVAMAYESDRMIGKLDDAIKRDQISSVFLFEPNIVIYDATRKEKKDNDFFDDRTLDLWLENVPKYDDKGCFETISIEGVTSWKNDDKAFDNPYIDDVTVKLKTLYTPFGMFVYRMEVWMSEEKF